MSNLTIDSLLRLDDSGMPQPVDLRQMLNKDIRELYSRDKSSNKEQYINECIIIYMCGDPKSPARQEGLNDADCLKYAIRQTTLPSNYKPDILVNKLIKQYFNENITEAGRTLDNLLKVMHNINKLIEKYSEFLNGELISAASLERIREVSPALSDINTKAKEMPGLIAAINTARQNVMMDIQDQQSRGGNKLLSSMNAEEYDG